MSRFKKFNLRLNNKLLNEDLGSNNFIFVGSSTDMFADNVPSEWIEQTIKQLMKYNNTYLFQTKNPKRYLEFINLFDESKSILGTTIETNRDISNISDAPSIEDRVKYMEKIKLKKTITFEPIVDFDIEDLLKIKKRIKPEFISIGAITGMKAMYDEPNKEKLLKFIEEAKKITKIEKKNNLERLLT